MARKKIVIVGAGLGGLAAAARLAHRGEDVLVVEKTADVGGRNQEQRTGACAFDGGPTLLMMLDPFRTLFTDVGEKLEDHLSISLIEPSYRVFFADGTRIEASTSVAKMVDQIRVLCSRKDSLAYPKMLGDMAALYADAVPNFVEKNYYSLLDFVSLKDVSMVLKHSMLSNLAEGIARYVEDPRLRMLFSFQTMYLGLSPFDAPWVYSVLTYMEYGEGIWYPKGGMAEITKVTAQLATKKGATIRLNTPVATIEGNTVVLENGERIEADAIICNADVPYAEKELLKKQPSNAAKRRYSCSAFMMYVSYKGSLPTMLHHNIIFGADFQGNLEQIFTKNELPDDPAFYCAISARSDPSRAPEGYENLFILVPCSNLDRPWTEADQKTLQQRVFARLTKEVGFEASCIETISYRTPQDWARQLNLDKGAAFGLSHDFWQSTYFRPQNRSASNPNVFYVGASTVPGNGLPMVLISADLAIQRMQHDGVLPPAQ